MKPRIYGMTVEVGSGVDGFWPTPARIIELADENLDANLAAARLAGECFGLELVSQEQKRDNDTIACTVRLINTGVLSISSGVTAQFSATNGTVVAPSNVFVNSAPVIPMVVRVKRGTGVVDGGRVRLNAQMLSLSGRFMDSVEVRAGVPAIILSDAVDSARAAWTAVSTNASSLWDTTSISAYSGRLSYTDSPSGPYPNNLSSSYTLKNPLPLGGTGAELRFRARWQIEHEYDFAVVEITTNGGSTWIPLPTQHTRPGSGVPGGKQPAGIPGFDRRQRAWVEEVADLDPFVGSTVRIRFRLDADAFGQDDGMYVDDVRLLVYRSQPTGVDIQELPSAIRLLQNFPNPFNGQTRIRFDFISGRDAGSSLPVTLKLYDVLGQERAVLLRTPLQSGVYEVPVDASALPSGFYFYQLRCGEMVLTRPMVLVR